jgi:hypothetical protein
MIWLVETMLLETQQHTKANGSRTAAMFLGGPFLLILKEE